MEILEPGRSEHSVIILVVHSLDLSGAVVTSAAQKTVSLFWSLKKDTCLMVGCQTEKPFQRRKLQKVRIIIFTASVFACFSSSGFDLCFCRQRSVCVCVCVCVCPALPAAQPKGGGSFPGVNYLMQVSYRCTISSRPNWHDWNRTTANKILIEWFRQQLVIKSMKVCLKRITAPLNVRVFSWSSVVWMVGSPGAASGTVSGRVALWVM